MSKSNNKKIKKEVIVYRSPSHATASRGTSRRSRQSSGSSVKQNMVRDYIRTLEDPWENAPMKLGYDTFVTTVLATGYIRSSFVVNADGSFAIYYSPGIGWTVGYNNSGANGVTWSAMIDCVNKSAISNQMLEARVVSGGLRIMCLYPQTSTPGVLFACTDSGTRTYNDIKTYSPTAVAGLPGAEIGLGSHGCRGYTRPIDPMSYVFASYTVGGVPGTNYNSNSTLLFAGLGFPAGTIVWYEAIVNIEGLPLLASSTVGVNPSSNTTTESSLSTYFPTPSMLYQSISGLLQHATTMDSAINVATSMASAAGVPYAHTMGRIARSAFGRGDHYLVAGRGQARIGRQATLAIEEIKEDYERV